jgi:hypothetical protein
MSHLEPLPRSAQPDRHRRQPAVAAGARLGLEPIGPPIAVHVHLVPQALETVFRDPVRTRRREGGTGLVVGLGRPDGDEDTEDHE